MKTFLLALLLAAPAALHAATPDATALQIAHDLGEGREEAVAARFNAQMAAAVTLAQLTEIMRGVHAESGALTSVELIAKGPQLAVLMHFAKGATYRLLLTLDGEGRIAGLFIKPAVDPAAHDNDETKARLRPPFRGTWTAHNADRNSSNHHYSNASQRFAVDWLIVDEKGVTHKGDGKSLSDYFAYGQQALAAAEGTVVTVVDGIPENTIVGETDPYFVPGNIVVLDLGNGEFATYCHLIPGSMLVKKGDRVKAGAPLARVGNSGNSTEPHLHFHLSDSPRMATAHGLPAKFRDVIADGKKVESSWPVEGTKLTGADATP
jgi:hypothetical protein